MQYDAPRSFLAAGRVVAIGREIREQWTRVAVGNKWGIAEENLGGALETRHQRPYPGMTSIKRCMKERPRNPH
jgi:hypothetical protein